MCVQLDYKIRKEYTVHRSIIEKCKKLDYVTLSRDLSRKVYTKPN